MNRYGFKVPATSLIPKVIHLPLPFFYPTPPFFFLFAESLNKNGHISYSVSIKCCANCKDKSNSACLRSPFSYHPVSLKGILSINIKAKLTLISHSDVELCSKKLLSYENTGVPVLLGMLITVALSLHIFSVLRWYSGTRRKLMG